MEILLIDLVFGLKPNFNDLQWLKHTRNKLMEHVSLCFFYKESIEPPELPEAARAKISRFYEVT